jgi:precorrin-2 dehydrogenase/sirohydrochlorin ferrochelatase
MRLFPVALNLSGRSALIVGAGGEAPRAAERLLEAGARVTVVAPGAVHEAIARAAAEGRLALHRRAFEDRDLEGAAVVLVAAADEALSQRLYEELADAGRLVCTLDRPDLSSFVNMAVVTVPGLKIAFSSGGVSPGALRRIREDLGALFSDPRLARYLEALRGLRERLPRGAGRAERMRAAVEGFGVEGRLRFPAWFEGGPGRLPPVQGDGPGDGRGRKGAVR